MIPLNNKSLKKKIIQILKVDWNDRKTNSDIISILNFIEDNEVKIRESYFQLIQSISKKKINGKSLSSYYKYNLDYNLWNMSNVYESSFYKSPQITNIIKFLALEMIISKKNPKKIILLELPVELNEIIRAYCSKSKIYFELKKQKKRTFNFRLTKTFIFFKGLLFYFRKLFTNLLSFNSKADYFLETNNSFIISYLTHIDKEKISKKYYGTGLWGNLPELIKKFNIKINWLHIPVDFKNSDHLFVKLNIKRSNNSVRHNFIFSFLDIKSWLEILKDYFLYVYKGSKINTKDFFNYKNLTNLFPLFEIDFVSSTGGAVLIENLIFIKSFDNLFSSIPNQKIGFYLQENQGWEHALNNAWRRYNHGKLISVQHTTVSFWDLRYDNKFRYQDCNHSPYMFIVNSELAKYHFKNLNYDENQVYLFEALRYLGLKHKDSGMNNKDKILILGDIMKQTTLDMLEIIYKTIKDTGNKSIKFKSHPAQPIKINANRQDIETIDEPLSEILLNFNTVICPASSGAAVESFYGNLNTIVFVSRGELNTSPLKDFKDVNFFSNSKELKSAMDKRNERNERNKRNEIFLIDKKTPRWNKFLKNIYK